MSEAPSAPPIPRARTLLVGFTSCDQAIAQRLMAAGRMPTLAALRAAGAWGTLRPAEPLLPEPLWTSLATGCLPARHGVLAPWVARQDGGGAQPAGRADWRAPAFWQLLEAAGRPTLTLGWPATAPATGWPGTHVDVRFGVASGPDFAGWAVPRRSVSPPERLAELRALRVHPTDIEGGMLAPFVPRIAEIDQYRDPGLAQLAVALAQTSTLHAATTGLLETADWEVAAVQYDWLEAVQRQFGAASAEGPFAGVVEAAYGFADALLARLIQLAGPGATLWVVSPNGVRHQGPTMAWRGIGFQAVRGPGILAGSTLPAARLVDVAPSLLARYGLAVACDGAALPGLAAEGPRRSLALPSIPPPAPDRHVEALRALGYDDAPTPAGAAALQGAEVARLLALGEALLAAARLPEAEAALQAARAILPAGSPAGLQRLALIRILKRDAAGARAIGTALCQAAPQTGWGDVVLAASHALEGNAPAAWPHMIAARDKAGDDPALLARLGGISLLLNEDISATGHFRAALALDPDLPAAQQGLAMAEQLTRKVEAEQAARRAGE